jgi:hypothetical protein
MGVHKWRRRATKYFGDVLVPFAQIQIRGNDARFRSISLQVDSGAVVSLLRRSVADLLGIELTDGRRIELGGVGGGSTGAYLHSLHTRFANNIEYAAPFAIAETEAVPNLLGRHGIFDQLQIDFDATVESTMISPPWLRRDWPRIWKFFLETDEYILARWNEMDWGEAAAKEAAAKMMRRAGELAGGAAGLSKLHRSQAIPLFIRAMFELALQFEYLMAEPQSRGRAYLDYSHITKHEQARALAANPVGPISEWIAESPDRTEVEKRNKENYERVRAKFTSKTKRGEERLSRNWYCMSVHDLAEKVGWSGEYRLWYTSCSAWAHCDPFSTQGGVGLSAVEPVLVIVLSYYARMLLRAGDRMVLSAEQYDFLRKLATRFE